MHPPGIRLPGSRSACCCLRGAKAAPISRHQRPDRRACSVKAQKDDNGNASTSNVDAEREQRLSTLEKRGRRRDMMPQSSAQQQKPKEVKSGLAEWKEGKLLPEGWDKMDPPQQAYELYTGKRGLLFWANKLAYSSLFVIGGAWVLFRFVGPSLGLYKLANDITTPNL